MCLVTEFDGFADGLGGAACYDGEGGIWRVRGVSDGVDDGGCYEAAFCAGEVCCFAVGAVEDETCYAGGEKAGYVALGGWDVDFVGGCEEGEDGNVDSLW